MSTVQPVSASDFASPAPSGSPWQPAARDTARERLAFGRAFPATVPAMAVEGLGLRYGGFAALDGVSLVAAPGEILCLLGPSGSGKSTLLRLVAGVARPTAGRVLVDGVEVASPQTFVEPEQRRVGMVFQDYALFPHLTVAANVAFGLRSRPPAEVGRTVTAMLERVDLLRHSTRYPHMLSGGERQRVALARALAPGPRIMLLDEPFSSLDGRLREDVRQQTIDLLRETGTTTVVVTHDPDEAMRIGDRIALLHSGRLVQCGSPEELYEQPSTLFAARVFGEVNELHGTCRNGWIDTTLGRFAAPRLPDLSSACVCIRPEHLRLSDEPTGIRARVLRTEFLGEIDHVVLEVQGLPAPLTLRAFGRTRLRPEDQVYLDVRADDALIVTTDDN